MSDCVLTAARYGKALVRVFRVVREGNWHNIVEYNVEALLEGDISTSYTQADNSVVVATDSIKNITYYLAKTSPHILNPERFALHLGTFLVSKYAHISKAFITIEQLRWSRIRISGDGEGYSTPKEHPHSFVRDGEDKVIVKAEVDGSGGKDKLIGILSSGIKDLLILKSTGSAFQEFIQDEYTTLTQVSDRIFSTSVDLIYQFAPIKIPTPSDENKLEFIVPSSQKNDGGGEAGYEGSIWDDQVPIRARTATLETFALDHSASVQATLYKMAQRIIAENPSIQSVSYSLPNKHYIPIDMSYIGLENLKPDRAEVFMPVSAPSGLITATISRKVA